MEAIKKYRFYGGTEKNPLKNLPQLTWTENPELYTPPDKLIDAVNVAIMLGKPLLVTGDPGTGKTQLAFNAAHQLKLGEQKEGMDGKSYHTPFHFTAKHNSIGQDLLYRYDSLSHFSLANQAKISMLESDKENSSKKHDPEKFVIYGALGEAIRLAHEKKIRSVVLIDEIDKAPREFPNDLLTELEKMEFEVPEIRKVFKAPKNLSPIVIVTSNREKELPRAFLRRCIFYNIDFPNREKLLEIVNNRLTGTKAFRFDRTQIEYLLDHFDEIREKCKTDKKPSTSDLLSWLQVLNVYQEFDPQDPIEWDSLSDADKYILQLSYSVLVKYETDLF